MLIDQLPEITTANDADEMPIEQGTTTRKIKILNLLKGVVSKAGDTISGLLTINGNCLIVKRDGSNGILIDDLGDDSTVSPSSARNGTTLGFRDKNGAVFGVIRARHTSSSYKGLYLYGNNSSAPSGHQLNGLYLLVNDDGELLVSMTEVAPWRRVLGLGTNGALPITIAQGGTGATTVNGAKGNLGLDRLESVQYSAANGTTANITLASSKSGVLICSGAAASARELIWFNCTSTGSVSVTRLRNVSDGLTVTTGTNKIAIANASGAYVYIISIFF